MKKMKKLLALVLAAAMVLAMTVTAFAADGDHTITVTNADQNVAHSYEAYQVFSGTLDSAQQKLTNIAWGSGVNGSTLLTALKASTDPLLLNNGENRFKDCTTATDVAKVLSAAPFVSTAGADAAAGAIDAVAAIVAENLTTAKVAFTANGTTYTATVNGDGYYFVKDTTTTLINDTTKKSDTLSKYLLSVVKDVTMVAKDTGFTPDKKILKDAQTKVAADSAAIGDVVDFNVSIPVPNTKKYVDHFIFNMDDTLPAGLTFFGLDSIKIDGTDLPAANYEFTAKTGAAAFTVPADADAAVTTTGGQALHLVFKDFKAYVEDNNLIGKDIVIAYKAVVNKDANFTATGNENEVEFKYSSDPNHVYDGDEPDSTDPVGTTPKVKTRSYLTKVYLLKTDENGQPLAGATFEFTGDALNTVLLTGEKYEKAPYTAKDGETIETGDYWKLKDGKYTANDPATPGMDTSKYDNPNEKYVKVSFSQAVTKSVSTKITATTDKSGHLYFEGLNAGTYKLKETIAPEGFNLDTTEYTLKINWVDPLAAGVDPAVAANAGFSIDESASSKDATGQPIFKIGNGNNQIDATIINKSGSELPSTGGIGTTIFYVVGAVLVIGASVIMITRRRMDAQ